MKNLAFDIGANNGNFTDTIVDQFKTIVCFEPVPYLINGKLAEKSKTYSQYKMS